jgi:hypothetical protein
MVLKRWHARDETDSVEMAQELFEPVLTLGGVAVVMMMSEMLSMHCVDARLDPCLLKLVA